MGNKVNQGELPANFDNTVETQQEINPVVLKAMDDFYGKPGASTKHEVLESYEGAVTSKQSGVSAGNSNKDPKAYKAAHQAAPPQSGQVYQDIIDQNGIVVPPTDPNAQWIRYEVRDNCQPNTPIMTYP
jgi:hypothetical protein